MKRIFCAVLLFAAAGSVPAAESGGTLERVVIVQRHGVRSPTKPPAAYARYSSEAWPDWPVAPGELTPHGAENIRLMAAWLRGHYAGLGLLPAEGCPAGRVSVWADGADERTRDSGQAFLDGAFPGCGLVAEHGPDGRKDPVFDAAQLACRPDPEASRQALAAAERDLESHRAEIAQAEKGLADILKLPAGETLDLKTDASLAENLLLEYGQGMVPAQVGWGRASADDIAQVMALHNLSSALTRRTPYVAAHNGAVLARMVLAALKGEGDETLKLIAGHDTNLSNLAGILGVSWTLPGQPDETPPGGALAFELWRDKQGHRSVKLAFFYQPLEDMRAGAKAPLGEVAVSSAMPLGSFVKRVEKAIPVECRKD